ncbi:MAG: TonB-dependent receptor [Bacteroidota bacterium]
MTNSIFPRITYDRCFRMLHKAQVGFEFHQRKARLFPYVGILTLLISGMLSAQTSGKISGVVTDAVTGEPLIGANIVVLGTSMGAATDIEGTFFMINIPAGKYDLQASMIGYDKMVQLGVIVNSGRTTTADFKIKPTTIEQEAVTVEATRPDVEPEKTSTSSIIRSEDVQQLAGMRDVGDVIGLAADVTDGHFRGGRSGEELYTLQGMGITNPLDNSTGLLPIMSAVEEVEVVTSGFGAQYGNAQSGVVNISMKEGKADKWHSYAEVNTTLPANRYFGGNPYSVSDNRYLQTMLNDTTWYNASTGKSNRIAMGVAANSLANDSVVQIAMARALWLQSKRYLNNTSYKNNLDYSVEFSTGGPIADNVRMFLALYSITSWPELIVEHPDVQQQIMGNIVADMGHNATLRFSAAYSQNNTNQFPNQNNVPIPGFYNYLWDDILSIQRQSITNQQAGIRFTQAVSQRTFYEVKLSTLQTRMRLGSTPFASDYVDSLRANILYWGTVMMQAAKNPPDGLNFGGGNTTFQDEKSQTVSLDASLTSQVTKSHLLDAGIQANYYTIDVNDRLSMGNNYPVYDIYSAHPLEASLFVQDKMEFEGMIANIGLRWDLWDENSYSASNLYAPYYQNPYSTDTTGKLTYLGSGALNQKVPIVGRLQPRIGISFPISVSTVFHLNYGSFMQRPAFQYLLDSRNTMYQINSPTPVNANRLGNPTLKPQITNSYDVGVMLGFGEGLTLDVSGYYKNVKDLIQQATFGTASGSLAYTTWINRDYANIRGFRLILNKRSGDLFGSVNYQYSYATGKSSTVGSSPPIFYYSVPVTDSKDILLDFDRTHNILINLGYATQEKWGFAIGKTYPLGDIVVSSNSFLRSGRPYTLYGSTGGVVINNMRSPWEYNTNLKISKRFRDFFGVTATLYMEVFNLFDNRIFNYNYVFQLTTAGEQNQNAVLYNTLPIDAQNGLRYLNDAKQNFAYLGLDKDFLLYSNQPRSFHLGFSIDF